MADPTPPDMVTIPAGSFIMGATADDKFASMLERPQHEVRFARPFQLARTPVTRLQWFTYASANPGVWQPTDMAEAADDWPIMGLTREDVDGYIRWLREATGKAYRLPSEAEWEYAARASTDGVFYTGSVLGLDDANYLYGEQAQHIGLGHPTPVGRYPANPWGLYDMLGSVSELVADDWHGTYTGAPTDGSPWIDDPPGEVGVVRGGSWDYLPRLLRCAYRDALPKTKRVDITGFRVACDDC